MNIGEKIKELRVRNNLTQEELADRCELTKGFISQLERDLTSPSISTLIDILECLGTNLKDFFSEEIEEKIVFHKEDVFETQNDELKYVLSWIIPNSQKNLM
ncbi:helix-turn-helix transcriptional regulator, partial [Vibrio parahaemolyticus]|nr:helix-turn-helix transcriptional regulator [Vibrio parahaemolyticus]